MSLWREPESRPVVVDGGLPELIFELEWKKPTKSSKKREDIRARIGIWDPPDPTLDLLSFKSYLCQNLGLSGDVAVSYVDSDGDELPIDSECEFREALKFARAQTKKYKNVLLMIDKIEKYGVSDKNTSKQSPKTSACGGLFVIQPKSSSSSSSITNQNNMAPIVMNDLIDGSRKMQENLKSASSPSSSEAIPPIWFKSYMETLKNDIVKEVSSKVMADVIAVVNKSRSEPCPSCSHVTPRGRHSRETNTEEKQLHRKKKKRVVEEVESSDAFSPPQQPDVQLLRKVKKIEKRERNLQRKLDHKLERLEQMTRIIVETKDRCHDVVAIAKNLNKGCKLNETTTNHLVASAPPQDIQNKEQDAASNISSCAEGRPRMNCSVTGNEMMEKTISKEVAYESDSDSDNISIISGISNVSDLDQDYNFEMIQTPPCFILDKPLNLSLNNREPQSSKAQEKLDNNSPSSPEKQGFNVVCEAESDRNNNRDSPSYEVLSGPASSTSSIHLDEDHFHMGRNISEQTTNADLIDLNNDDPEMKRGSALVVDTQGKIFDKNIIDDKNEPIEMYLDKRPGGAYAFVNETLPIHNNTKELSQMSKSETNVEQFTENNCNLNMNMKTSHPSYETKERTGGEKCEKSQQLPQAATQSQSNFESRTEMASGTNHESIQSFSSHTSYVTDYDGAYGFSQDETMRAGQNHVGKKYPVVDRNASKGLGETKYTSSIENNLGARGCQGKRDEKINGKYQRGFTSEDSGCVFTEQPQKSSPEDGTTTRESSPDFGRTTNDSVHILPETLVSGAVTLASSAYSTARKAFDRIRNMQTGEGNENVENGVTIGSDIEGYFSVLEEMGFTNMDLNARLLDQFNYDMSRVISELVQ